MPFFNQLFNETFSGPDANPIDPAKWTTAVGGIAFQQLSHFLVNADATLACNANYTGVAVPANQYVDVTIHNAANGSDCEIVLRANADQTEAYVFYVDSNGDGTADSALVSYVGGNPTELFDFGTISFVADDVFRFAILGTTLFGYRNGTLLGSVVNADHASGLPGLFMADGPSAVVTALQIGRFAGGTVSATSQVYSVTDSRNYGTFPNSSVNVQGTLTYTVPSVDSRTAGAPVDSRAVKPTDCRVTPNIPLNSRTSP